MNVANLKNGDTIKSYKQLCSLLEIKPCGGDSKKSQIKKMQELFLFERNGNAFYIKEVYNEKHSSLSSGHFASGIQKILLTKMIDWKTNIITMKFSEWIDWLGIINPDYTKNRYSKSSYIKDTTIPMFDIDNFYVDTWTTIRTNVMYAIDDLDKKNIIRKKNMITICFKGTKKNKIRLVSNSEYERIKQIEKNVLSRHGLKNMAVAHMTGRYKDISVEIMEEVNSSFMTDNILYYYDEIRLALNRKIIDYGYRYDNIPEIQIDINNKLIDKFRKHFLSRSRKARDELESNIDSLNVYDRDKYENLAAKAYIESIIILMEDLIKIDSS